jgi:alkanesulfonate monooxygenase SsuD/methylene tetrahydromethanopterin reductase-like flavin-dependent oxidoreductase (luciferase family)
MIASVREAARRAGRDPAAVKFCVAAPAYVGDDLAHQREQTRWFGGMVGNHVADIVARYGTGAGDAGGAGHSQRSTGTVPAALTDYIAGRRGYDYAEHGRAGNSHTDFVPDEIVDRFCILGPVDNHLSRLRELQALGVDQFAIYLQHDDKEHTLEAYGSQILPQLS